MFIIYVKKLLAPLLPYYMNLFIHINESLHTLNISKTNDFKASAGVKNDLGSKLTPGTILCDYFLGTLTKVKPNS